MLTRKKFLLTRVFFWFIAFLFINAATAINYAFRQDVLPKNVTQADARTTRQILEVATKIKKLKKRYTLQEGTEHLLQFGALFRTQILDTFGYLVYDRYDDFSISQMEALYRVYHETLERKYNIFDIVISFFESADIRPTKVCQSINKNVHTCLKESSQLCMSIKKHNKRRLINLNYTPQIYQLAKIQHHFPDGFSLKIILKHLQNNTLKFTPSLLSGLLHNIQYDSFDDEVRTAERELILYLIKYSKISKDSILMTSEEMQNQTTVSGLLRTYLKTASVEFKSPANFHAKILAEHVVREVEAISQNIELLGAVYENNTINLKTLFNLVLPPDVIDKDLSEAKEYLLDKADELQVVSKYLKIEKYQQAGPDQLLMEILGQMRDIHFAVDIVSALHTHTRFWHRNRAIEGLNEFLDLFSSYENLRKIKDFEEMMKTIDEIKSRLWDSKNVTIEIYCSNPRACLQIGLQILMKCEFIDEETKNLIKKFGDTVTAKGSPAKEECHLREIQPTECNNESAEVNPEIDESPGATEEPKTEYPLDIKQIMDKQENKTTTLFDTVEPSSEAPDILTSIASEETNIAETSTKLGDMTTTEKMMKVAETNTELEVNTEVGINTSTILSKTAELTTIDNAVVKSKTTESSTSECSSSEECSSECSNQDCSSLECSGNDCSTSEKSSTDNGVCEGTDCPNKEEEEGDCKGKDCPDRVGEGDCKGRDCPNKEGKGDCRGKDCPDKEDESDCKGQDCQDKEGEVGCEGKNCSEDEQEGDCKGKDCPSKEAEGDCKGKDCRDKERGDCDGTDCPDKEEGDCKGKDCPDRVGKGDCKGRDCLNKEGKGDCKGKNCLDKEGEGTCEGTDCPDEERKVDCKGKDCPNKQKVVCKGQDCLHKEGEDDCKESDCPKRKVNDHCEGTNCSDEETATNCSGSDCPNKEEITEESKTDCKDSNCAEERTEAPCTGPGCAKSDCNGKDCPPALGKTCSGDDCIENSKNKTVFCDNTDPHHRRKKERLQKMRQLGLLPLVTSEYKEVDSEVSRNEDYSSSDEVKPTGFDKINRVHENLNPKPRIHKVSKSVTESEEIGPQDQGEKNSKNHLNFSTEKSGKTTKALRSQLKMHTNNHETLERGRKEMKKSDTDNLKQNLKDKAKIKIVKKNSNHSHFKDKHSDQENSPENISSDKLVVDKKTKGIKDSTNSKKNDKREYLEVTESNKDNLGELHSSNFKSDQNKKQQESFKKPDLEVSESTNVNDLSDISTDVSNTGKEKHSSQKDRNILHKDLNLEEEPKKMQKSLTKLTKHRNGKKDIWEDEVILENNDQLKNENLSPNEDSLKMEDLPKISYGKHQPRNSYRRSNINFPLDVDDAPLVYQTQKPNLKTVQRSYFADLLNQDNNVQPENRIFADHTFSDKDKINKNRAIFYPKSQEPIEQEDVLADKDYYTDIDDSSDSRSKWLAWFQ